MGATMKKIYRKKTIIQKGDNLIIFKTPAWLMTPGRICTKFSKNQELESSANVNRFFSEKVVQKYYLGSIFFSKCVNVRSFSLTISKWFLLSPYFSTHDILINTSNEGLSLIKKILRTIFLKKPKSIIIICHNSTFFDTTRS